MRAIVLVGHGSRRCAGNAGIFDLRDRVAARLGVPVFAGFIELATPSAGDAIDAAVDAGADEVVVVPAVLLAAGHAKNDLPVIVARARRRHPTVRLVASAPLGVHPGMLEALRDRLRQARAGLPPCEDDQVGVLLLGRGSSDPDANADVYKIGRLLCERQGLRGHEVGFVGVTTPDIDAALRRLVTHRPRQVVILPYLLYPGVLVERVNRKAQAFAAMFSRVDVAVSEPVGTHPRVLDVLAERADAAIRGDHSAAACDTCKYRTPLPGFEHELGGRQALRKAAVHATLPVAAGTASHGHQPPRRHVLVCVNRDCVDRGSLATLDRLRRRIRTDGLTAQIRTTRVMCVGRCGEGPAVCVYPEGVWYRGVTADQADRIYEEHLLGNHPLGSLVDQVLSGA
ncbi:MAG: ferredoxin [Deltaproteobacteria bacterium]|nr:MAG: ferredoxin [Deltaproteobacteria bacterium]